MTFAPAGSAPPEVSVIIPCLNEAGDAARYPQALFAPLDLAGFSCEVLFSDGGSSDGTADLLAGMAAARPGVRLLRSDGPSSFADSIARAVPACRGRYIAFLEADLSFAPLDLAKLLAAAKELDCDCVCGSPFLGGFEGLHPVRRLLTGTANLLLRLRFGRAVTSYTQIFKLYRAEVLRQFPFENSGFTLDAELLARTLAGGYKVAEVPVTMTARSRGRSKLNAASEIFNCLRLIARGVGTA